MFLAEAGDREQDSGRSNRDETQPVVTSCSNVDHAGRDGGERRQQLALAHDVRHCLDVHRVHGEQRRSACGGSGSDDLEEQCEHRDADSRVQHDTREMKHPRTSIPGSPLERVPERRDWPIERRAITGRPVWLREQPPPPLERMDPGVAHDDRQVVEREAVPEARRRRRDGEGNDPRVQEEARAL